MRVRLPPTYRQLCVIAREQITAAPTIDNFEWAERIKWRLAALGFAMPARPDQIPDAMRAMQRALEKLWGPRPVPRPARASTMENPPPIEPPWPRRSTGAQPWTAIAQMVQGSKPPNSGTPIFSGASMGIAKPLTLRQAERQKALKILAQGILEQVARCDEAERDPETES